MPPSIFHYPERQRAPRSNRDGAWRDSSLVAGSEIAVAAVSQNDAQVVAIIGRPCTLFYNLSRELLLDRRNNCLEIPRLRCRAGRRKVHRTCSPLYLILLLLEKKKNHAFLVLRFMYKRRCFLPCGLAAVRWPECCLIKVQ